MIDSANNGQPAVVLAYSPRPVRRISRVVWFLLAMAGAAGGIAAFVAGIYAAGGTGEFIDWYWEVNNGGPTVYWMLVPIAVALAAAAAWDRYWKTHATIIGMTIALASCFLLLWMALSSVQF